MSNDQIPKSNERDQPDFSTPDSNTASWVFDIGAWGFIEHWSLSLGHSKQTGNLPTRLLQFQTLPFVGNWEATAALKSLYNNPTLVARFYCPDLAQTGPNILDTGYGWSKTVLVYYDPAKPSMEIVLHPQDLLLSTSPLAGYDPLARIVDRSSGSLSYRWLVK